MTAADNQHVFGVELEEPLRPEDGTPVDVLVVAKCLKPATELANTADHPYQLVIRSSQISTWEAHGMASWVQQVAFDEDLYGEDED